MQSLERLFRRRKSEYVLIKRTKLMQINEALDAALVQAHADKKSLTDKDASIATLTAEVAAHAVADVDPIKAKALADAVMGGDTASMPVPAV